LAGGEVAAEEGEVGGESSERLEDPGTAGEPAALGGGLEGEDGGEVVAQPLRRGQEETAEPGGRRDGPGPGGERQPGPGGPGALRRRRLLPAGKGAEGVLDHGQPGGRLDVPRQ